MGSLERHEPWTPPWTERRPWQDHDLQEKGHATHNACGVKWDLQNDFVQRPHLLKLLVSVPGPQAGHGCLGRYAVYHGTPGCDHGQSRRRGRGRARPRQGNSNGRELPIKSDRKALCSGTARLRRRSRRRLAQGWHRAFRLRRRYAAVRHDSNDTTNPFHELTSLEAPCSRAPSP